ncbi:hypothetical protein [Methanoplanus limicola]|uniref:Replication restart DNA helicase PriA n=1 Tax=Methanoplanus limicola DSM 2279 TaxID=937775 RepID=H1Z129_9EURY|nr:hypothetical protein [Methanoplanus limicola]EHQ34505.1 replication restart DNA helicase PriA [Methanoplanus limicola DSM 2279]
MPKHKCGFDEKIRCKKCGRFLEDNGKGSLHCPYCGRQATIICPGCGRPWL